MDQDNADFPEPPLPLRNVGIIFSCSDALAEGRENEKCADCEVIDVAIAIQAALTQRGIQVELVNLEPDQFPDLLKFDYVFNLAESIYGFPLADYQVAERLEALNINFTGAGSSSLKACVDKAFTKKELLKFGIQTPAFELYLPGQAIHTRLNFPVIVKPVHEDGSFGITNESVVWNDAALQKQVLNTQRLYLQAALVEEYIEGRDVTASILGNGPEAVCLPLSEIVYPEENDVKFLTFEAKWVVESTDFRSSIGHCPCMVDADIEAEISRIALAAYQIMNCRDYARIDFRLRGKEIFVLEVNPNPCLNPDDSGFVRCGNAKGYRYNDLIYQILLLSYKNRYLERDSISLGTRYDRYLENTIKHG